MLQRDVAVPLPKRDTGCVAQQPHVLAFDTVGAQACAIGSYDAQVGVRDAADGSLPDLSGIVVLIPQTLQIAVALFVGQSCPCSELSEGAVVVPFPGVPAFLPPFFALCDLAPASETDLVEGFHFFLAHGLLVLGSGHLHDGVDAASLAFPGQDLLVFGGLGSIGW